MTAGGSGTAPLRALLPAVGGRPLAELPRGLYAYVMAASRRQQVPLVLLTLLIFMAPAFWGYSTRVFAGDGALHLLGIATNLVGILVSLLGNCIMVVILARAWERGEDRRTGIV